MLRIYHVCLAKHNWRKKMLTFDSFKNAPFWKEQYPPKYWKAIVAVKIVNEKGKNAIKPPVVINTKENVLKYWGQRKKSIFGWHCPLPKRSLD